jgi:hypothetical protein
VPPNCLQWAKPDAAQPQPKLARLAASYQQSAVNHQLPENCLLFAFNFAHQGLVWIFLQSRITLAREE